MLCGEVNPMSQIGDALFTETQQKVLGLLYGQPNRSFYTNEILRLTGMGVATIKRELDRMLVAGILTMTRIGNQHHYQANPGCPVYTELITIVKRTIGVAELIRLALVPLQDRIAWAFVFGSVASGKDTASSDVDLMVIGEVTFPDIVKALYPAQLELGRDINPKLYSREQWHDLALENSAFFREVMQKPRMDVMGGQGEPGESGRNQSGEN